MTRVTNALLGSNSFGIGANQPMLDLRQGGQHGYSPNLTEWVSNQAYIRRNLICILLEAPGFFQLMPNPTIWVQSLKSLVELHARTIEGFNAALTVEFAEHPVGGGGEMQQEVTDVKRARTEPVFGFVEKYGRPIQTFLEMWIRYGMLDPDAKIALAGTLSSTATGATRSGATLGYDVTNKRPQDLLADWSTMTCLFIEPDILHKSVVKAWITTNMMPKETGPIEGKRDLTTASDLLELSIPFTGISQYGLGVNRLAQQILSSINITNAVPFLHKAFISKFDTTVNSALTASTAADGTFGDVTVFDNTNLEQGYQTNVDEYTNPKYNLASAEIVGATRSTTEESRFGASTSAV
ncbi:MAG: hypothetical protein ACR2HF_02520 [Methylococcaceae bacterium]